MSSFKPRSLLHIPSTILSVSTGTKHRYDLIKRLNTLRKTGKIHSYWTHDGSVLVKKTEQSRTINIKNRKDVYKLGGEILEEDETRIVYMYTIHKELFIYTTLNICKQKHVFLYEDSSNKTSEDNDEYELFAEVFKRIY
jgi:hypothetical protein